MPDQTPQVVTPPIEFIEQAVRYGWRQRYEKAIAEDSIEETIGFLLESNAVTGEIVRGLVDHQREQAKLHEQNGDLTGRLLGVIEKLSARVNALESEVAKLKKSRRRRPEVSTGF